jgi:hypothetical protein
VKPTDDTGPAKVASGFEARNLAVIGDELGSVRRQSTPLWQVARAMGMGLRTKKFVAIVRAAMSALNGRSVSRCGSSVTQSVVRLYDGCWFASDVGFATGCAIA